MESPRSPRSAIQSPKSSINNIMFVVENRKESKMKNTSPSFRNNTTALKGISAFYSNMSKVAKPENLNAKATISTNDFTTKDTDPIEDVLKTGYSQKSRMNNSILTNKSKKNRISKPKISESKQNMKIHKAISNSQERLEVNRILNVLHRNLHNFKKKPTVNYMPKEEDSQRDKIREKLQKHLKMKDSENKKSFETIQINAQLENSNEYLDFGRFMDQISRCMKGSPKADHPNESKLSSQILKNFKAYDEETENHEFEAGRDISMEFQNISSISNSFSSIGENLPSFKPELKNMFENNLKTMGSLDGKKMKLMCAMMQLYCMMQSKNPFDFTFLLKMWSTWQTLQK
jgi:hypothetical protein